MTTTVRRLLLALLALSLLAAACGDDDDGDSAAPDDSAADDGEAGEGGEDVDATADPSRCPVDELDAVDGPVTITMWHAMPDVNGEALEELAARYNDSQDRVRVELVFTGSYSETFERYRTTAGGDSAPDLVQLEETAIQQVIDSQTAVPAADCVAAADYDTSDHLQTVLDEFTVEGVLWPVPFNISTPVLYYSGNRFASAGLDPDAPPATLDELLEASRAIVDTGTSPQAFSLETQAWYIEQWYNLAGEPIVDQRNGRDGRATEALLDTPTGADVFGWVDAMQDEELILDVGRNPSGADHFLAIGGNQASMTIGTSAALGGVYDVLTGDPTLAEEVGLRIGPLPGPSGGGVVPGGAALWPVDRGDPVRVAAAWDWSSWLAEPEQQAFWHTRTGYIPIRRSAIDAAEVQELWAERPGFEVAYRQLVDSSNEIGGPVIGGYPDFRDEIILSLERILQQGAEVGPTLTQLEADATDAIQDYNERVGG